MFISDVLSGTSGSQGNQYSVIFMLSIFGLLFYFMVLRPQKKRAKEHKKLVNSLTKGDEILTNGGLVGIVTKVFKTDYICISINDINEVIIKKDCIMSILPKGTIKSLS